jgi:hypothetical protein
MARRLLVPLLAGLLVTALMGPGVTAGAEPRATVTRTIMIPVSAFNPNRDGADFLDNGSYLSRESSNGFFRAPLSLPVPEANIRKITLYAYDANPAGYACLSLRRHRPADHALEELGQVCTTNEILGYQDVYATDLSPRRLSRATAAATLWLTVQGTNVAIYGVKVTYSYES